MEFPQFWMDVEERSNIAPNDILNLKQILTILGFKTMESISKLSSKSEMDKVELEFFKLKETNRFDEKYPNLHEEKFGVGMKAIINSIANQIKRGLFMENIDVNLILNSVYDECKMICPAIAKRNISIDVGVNGATCRIRCPFCSRSQSVSSYWTKGHGQKFNLFNLSRHMLIHTGNPDASASIHTSTFNISKNNDQTPLPNILNELNTLKGSVVMSAPVAESTILIQRSMDFSMIKNEDSDNFPCGSKHDTIATQSPEIERLRDELKARDNEISQLKNRLESAASGSNSDTSTTRELKEELAQRQLEIADLNTKVALLPLVQKEIDELRQIISSSQRSVLFNLCSTAKIENDGMAEIGQSIVKIKTQSGGLKKFCFNYIFNGDGDKLHCMKPILNVFLTGENSCVIVHGETGSGKSTSMYGKLHHPAASEIGIVSSAIAYLIVRGSKQLQASFIEFRDGKWIDLTNDNAIEEKLPKNYYKIAIDSVEDIQHYLARLLPKRKTKSTNQNTHSSRSHAVLILSNETSKMLFVDLAGNESVHGKENIMETCFINSSLANLNAVLACKAKGKIPSYHDNDFTHFLQPYLVKNKAVVFFHVNKENIAKDLLKIEDIVGTPGQKRGIKPPNSVLRL